MMDTMAYCNNCEQNPCACRISFKVDAPMDYIIQHCSVPGCHTAIREKMGLQAHIPTCKWCETKTSYALNGKPDVDIRMRKA